MWHDKVALCLHVCYIWSHENHRAEIPLIDINWCSTCLVTMCQGISIYLIYITIPWMKINKLVYRYMLLWLQKPTDHWQTDEYHGLALMMFCYKKKLAGTVLASQLHLSSQAPLKLFTLLSPKFPYPIHSHSPTLNIAEYYRILYGASLTSKPLKYKVSFKLPIKRLLQTVCFWKKNCSYWNLACTCNIPKKLRCETFYMTTFDRSQVYTGWQASQIVQTGIHNPWVQYEELVCASNASITKLQY